MMRYAPGEIMDLNKFSALMKDLFKISGIPHGLLDYEGNILSGVGWQDICVKFHRANPESAQKCKESNLAALNKSLESKGFGMHICPHGLVDCFAPIVVEGEAAGMLILGQFFFDKPDDVYFRKQAQQYGYDEDAYLEALANVPFFSREQVEACMNYYMNLADMLSQMGLTRIRQKKMEENLLRNNLLLKHLVNKGSIRLAEVNEQLEQDHLELKRMECDLKKKEEEERRLLEQIELDRLKNEFFANLSHEMKTPINLISGTLQLFEMDMKEYRLHLNTAHTDKRIRILKQNCSRLIRLINNLIDITKMDSGYFEFSLQNCNIISIVEDITLSVAEYIENHKIRLLFDTEVEEKNMAVDPSAIERIMLNILSNAVKFSKPDSEILVNLWEDGEKVLISVRDTGIGIPSDKVDVIFDRFRQVDKSLTRNHEGSGIGLSIVKSLVEMHGGHIRVESEYQKGTVFTIELPVITICDSHDEKTYRTDWKEDKVEMIHIEFSDIYHIS